MVRAGFVVFVFCMHCLIVSLASDNSTALARISSSFSGRYSGVVCYGGLIGSFCSVSGFLPEFPLILTSFPFSVGI